MAKVSIIIPTYNVEEYLRECMDSVVNQTLKDIEIICVNDGSTDSSLSILEEYAANDDRIIIIDKQNEGYGRGMNDGLDKATGEYIGIVEPDDFVDIHMYEDLYAIAKDLDLDIIKADFYRFVHPENKPLVATYNALSKDGTGYNQVVDPKEHPEIFLYVLNTWSGIYKRQMIEKYHIRHNTTPGASFQDNGFWFQTFTRAERVYFYNKPYYMNRRDNPNSSVKSKTKVYCMNDEYEFIHDYLDSNPELKEYFIYPYSIKRVRNYFWTYGRIAKEFKLEYLERLQVEFKEAMALNEFRQSDYTKLEWEKITRIIEDPKKTYKWMNASARARKIKRYIKKKLRIRYI
ncbi:MAG: glycosyltransferase [Erysipelotrichaceae bacterium]|nr:glycosyltransferase [Erysipelotrichaceae bacterium]